MLYDNALDDGPMLIDNTQCLVVTTLCEDKDDILDVCDNTLTHESPTLFLNSHIHTIEEEICFDDTMPSIYDGYNDECDLFSPPTIEHKIAYDYDMTPIYDDYNDDYDCVKIPLLLMRRILLMWRVIILL